MFLIRLEKGERMRDIESILSIVNQFKVPIIVLATSLIVYLTSIWINIKSTPLEMGPWESRNQKIINEISSYTMIVFGLITTFGGFVFLIYMLIVLR